MTISPPGTSNWNARISAAISADRTRHLHSHGRTHSEGGSAGIIYPEDSTRSHYFDPLFRGREDVCARRWESPDGRAGYSPNTERDWKSYYAAKPEDRKRVDKETRKSIPLDDNAIHTHLAGKHTLGVYPLLLDE